MRLNRLLGRIRDGGLLPQTHDHVDIDDFHPLGRRRQTAEFERAIRNIDHLAIVFGDIRDGEDVPVRLHPEDVVLDIFGRTDRLQRIMKIMGERKRGVIVYLREGSVGVGHHERYRPGQGGGENHEEAVRRESEWREIGLGAQILRDLGIASIQLMASRERHYVGLEGFGIRITRTEILERD